MKLAVKEGNKQVPRFYRGQLLKKKKAYQRGFRRTVYLNQVTFSNTQAAGKLCKRDIAQKAKKKQKKKEICKCYFLGQIKLCYVLISVYISRSLQLIVSKIDFLFNHFY